MLTLLFSLAACNDASTERSLDDVSSADTATGDLGTTPTDSSEPIDAREANDVSTASDVGPRDDTPSTPPTDVSTTDTGGSTATDAGTRPSNDTFIEDITRRSDVDPGEPGPSTFEMYTDSIVTGMGSFGGDESLELISLVPEGENSPIVLFMPGTQLVATDYTSTREHLASHGFAVVFPSFFNGSPLDIPDAHTSYQEDVVAVLDWIEAQASGPWAGKVDPTRIAAVGHSLGGKLSFLVATADDRIDAIAGIDPVDSGPPSFVPFDPADYPSVTPEKMNLITVPLLIMGETLNGSGGFQPCAPAEDNFEQYYAAATSPALIIDFLNANHMSFVDDPTGCGACSFCPAGTDDTAVTRLLMRRFLVAFLAKSLNSNAEWTGWLWGDAHTALQEDGLITSQSKNGFTTAL